MTELQGRKDTQGRHAVVRNGYQPELEIQTGIGAVPVPKVRDRNGTEIRFHSRLLPPYLGRTKSLEELIPWLGPQGRVHGDFQEALTALLGPQAKGLSAGTVSRLKAQWAEEHQRSTQRSLQTRRYVYLWADGVYFIIHADEVRQCILVIVGVDAQGHKNLGLSAGKRWRRLQGFRHLADVIDGVKFIDGVRAKDTEDSRIAA